jgi:mannose-6-phosphate isomerase-like protein (cupin superfamily)
MKLRSAMVSAILFAFVLLLSPVVSVRAQQKPRAKVIQLAGEGKELPLLSGPPETVSMRSGLILLQPQQSVGKHSTGQHEEMLVVLEGEGKMLFSDGSTLAIAANQVLYCPPETGHDVLNTGAGVLRYVYIVASTNLK